MISVQRLEKRYGGVTAVDGVSFDVGAGEVFGLVGPNGAGKTSTLKMLCGLVEPSAGDITVNGFDAGDTAMRRTLGFLPEESPLYDEMTPRSYLRFFADLYDVDRATANERIEAALDRLDLDARDRPVGDFSKGMTRKVAIARSLVNDPDVLVYDEPASGLDPLTTNTVIEFTRELAADGKTIVFSAHDLHHVESVCDRVAIMRDGQFAATGTLADIRDEHGEVSYRVFTDVDVDDARPSNGRYVTTVDSMADVDAIRAAAADAGGGVVDIRTDESTLEDVFLDVTGA
ncbi:MULTISPECIES: ABC transporter ATP-binding protein [Halobacterium]|uniref:ABC transporter, ATP-binding protein n=4 Tax=Halobacterium salinarum TaxID=2242 RepID=Q9HRH8_HALSA|nr:MULTISPECIES: ABC transporter ATP-binding protein [Halobacterium]AAG19180.1 ABC transporter, ATP-binding protein [Halobacterium salinarum NRC-1]MBB6090023.1 ABC-2 type transport system ATP-binding protein [Halobacterium salinarum]MCF2165745.1 ABC transporter ATP-binding protein [Halobacterium salinarum]MCF2166615.1 ABC transporter ATP-binding protein [Halobacterium salinarum]MCF2206600.1 ABC transporter ATP-binding protein [Halobacterium salinarum]